MQERLVIGNNIIRLSEVNSTNEFLKDYVSDASKQLEGLVVTAEDQLKGKGQRGNSWLTKKGENLTFSVYLEPSIAIDEQFVISKMVAISIVEFLNEMTIDAVRIKWPNDIYCGDKKICGVLIENTINKSCISKSIIGVGLNVNQKTFDSSLLNPTSVINELDTNAFDLSVLLERLMGYLDKNYLLLKTGKSEKIRETYRDLLYRLKEEREFIVDNTRVSGVIKGVNPIGRLLLEIDGQEADFGFKEVEYVI